MLTECFTLNNQVFTQDGTYVRQFGRNQLSSPNYVAIGEDNRIVVSDTSNNRIKIFDAQGHSVSTFGTVGTGMPTRTLF